MKNDYDPRMGFLTVFMSGVFGLIFIFFLLGIIVALWPWSMIPVWFGFYGLGKYFGHFK
jgi:hypothetical protein